MVQTLPPLRQLRAQLYLQRMSKSDSQTSLSASSTSTHSGGDGPFAALLSSKSGDSRSSHKADNASDKVSDKTSEKGSTPCNSPVPSDPMSPKMHPLSRWVEQAEAEQRQALKQHQEKAEKAEQATMQAQGEMVFASALSTMGTVALALLIVL
jgi:C4-dicarboxylate-specific signal transduction histidine kinase